MRLRDGYKYLVVAEAVVAEHNAIDTVLDGRSDRLALVAERVDLERPLVSGNKSQAHSLR